MNEMNVFGLTIRFTITNMLALPLAFSFSEQMPHDEFPGTELAVFVGPFVVSIVWGGDA